MTIQHAFVSAAPAGADPDKVRAADWNADHAVSGGSDGQFLARDSAQANGSQWRGAGPPLYGCRGLTGKYNAATPNTKFDVAADLAILYHPTTGSSLVLTSTGTLTCDTAVAGPAANGRDQAGAFAVSSWVHLYLIAKPDGTKATIFSAAAPPTGPTLPTGYTHWAYACTLRIDGSGNLLKVYLRGDTVFYEALQSVVSNGNATTETTVDVSGVVPPLALCFDLRMSNNYQDTSAGLTNQILLRLVSGVNYDAANVLEQVANQNFNALFHCVVPNVGQAYIYLWSAAAGTRSSNQTVPWFRVPNGAD